MNRATCGVGLAAVIGAAIVGGCVGYNVYPPETGTTGFSDPNAPPMWQIMGEAVRWTIQKYPPGEMIGSGQLQEPAPAAAGAQPPSWKGAEPPRLAVGLVSGLRRSVYAHAVRLCGPGSVPLTADTEHLPTYLVSRIWVGGDAAKVDLFRPVIRPGASPTYQGVTVNLRGGVRDWYVTSHKVWLIGALPIPEKNFIPQTGEGKSGPRGTADISAPLGGSGDAAKPAPSDP